MSTLLKIKAMVTGKTYCLRCGKEIAEGETYCSRECMMNEPTNEHGN